MSTVARPGYLGPFLAVALSVAFGAVGLWRFASHLAAETTARRAVAMAEALAAEPSAARAARLVAVATPEPRGERNPAPPRAPAARAVVVAGEAPGRYPFLRRLRLEVGGEVRRLSPADPDDKALADAYAAATGGTGRWVSGARAAVKLPGRDAVAVVEAQGPHRPAWLACVPLFPVGLVALAAWWFLLWRRRPARWPAAAGGGASVMLLCAGALSGMAWLAGTLGADVRATRDALGGVSLAPPDLARGALPVVALITLPLVVAGVAGFGSRSRRSPHRAAYAYVGPALLGMGVLVLAPFLFGVVLAFLRPSAGGFEWVGLDNFVRILGAEGRGFFRPLSFYFTLLVTVAWTAINVLLHAGIGLGLALLLNRPNLPFRGVYRMLLIVPWAVPNYITALIWKGMFNKQYGLVNNMLGVAGIEPIGWFSQFWTSFLANVVTNTWLGFPFMMVVCLGALQSIPGELYEAAQVDGATRWQRFRHITFPLLMPALLPAVILGSIWTFNMFNIVYLVSGGQPDNSTEILITEAYRRAFEQGDYGYAAAYSVLIFLILLSYSLLTQRVARRAEGAHA